MIIAVDAAGGDYAPHEIIKGAIKAAQEFDVEIALVGRKNVLRVMLDKDKAARKLNINIVEASQVIAFDEHPMKAVKNKPDSSIVVGINLVKNGEADAFVSAGSTGAVFCAAMLSLGVKQGVERPAIGCLLDALSSYPALLVDAGANVECRPQHLLEFARLGSEYSRSLLGIKSPTVGLLNIGTENTKGTKLVQETFQLLTEAKDINFYGNIEGHDIGRRTVDVIVTDGFTGNVVIKTIEGLNDNFLAAARQIGHIFTSISQHRGRDLLRDIGLGALTKRMDYTEFGGAGLLGINGNVIIAHGRSQAKAIKSAIALARQTVEGDNKVAQNSKEGSNKHGKDRRR
ncbi:MAG: phosphate acyltransferase PlsX [Dehalococcoidales bacterium]|nr:phosphate acyltransferase PlsX [Dehalococcoidales bacterium]